MRCKWIGKSLLGVLLMAGMSTLAQAAMPMDIMVTSNADSGPNTLRWAVAISNTTTGTQAIGFSLANSITVHSLIAVSAPVLIDGGGSQVIGSTGSGAAGVLYFAPGSDGSTLTGCALINSSRGVELNADYCLLTSCRLGVDFAGVAHGNNEGIRVFHANNAIRHCIIGSNQTGIIAWSAANLRVAGCYIGILSDDTARGNFVGVNLYQTVGCLVGGDRTDVNQRNVISRNTVGVIVQSFAAGNTLCGNIIGLNAAMTAAAPNTQYGIRFASQAFGNYVGLPQTNYGNIIAGNSVAGIYAYEANMGSQPRYNVIQNNLIGLNPSGAEFPNNTGILLTNADGFLIGGSSAGGAREANVISKSTNSGIHLSGNGNTISGNYIGTDATGYVALGNNADGIWLGKELAGSNTITSSGNLIGGPKSANRGNVISSNVGNGILFQNVSGNEISGNLIGLAVNSTALPNGGYGIYFSGASGNRFGRPDEDCGNVVSGHADSGIYLANNSNGNTLCGNILGLARLQGSAVPNSTGITLSNSHANAVGLPTGSYAANVISGNAFYGVNIVAANNNRVQNNLIGVNSGNVAIGNSTGVRITNGYGNLVGGNRQSNEHNVISGNGVDGVLITGGSQGNTLCGNIIGLSGDQNSARGNVTDGVILTNASHNVIGLPQAGWGNVIGANDIGVYMGTADANAVQNNLIGLNSSDASHPNLRAGIYMDMASHNLIGGPSAGNVITSSAINEIYMQDSHGNTVSGNLINLNAAGNSLLANYNQSGALSFMRAYGNFIGGYAANGNRICGRSVGLDFYDSSGNTVMGNVFGQFTNGQAAEASFTKAVLFSTNSHHNLLGDSAQGNQIIGGGVGVSGEAPTAYYNGFYRNLIHGQSVKAISLTNNSNQGITAPVVTSAFGQTITGQTQMFSDVVEVFQAEPAGNTYTPGGSLRYLGRAAVTGSGGPAPWSLVASSVGGEYVCATTSDTNRNTSEFSYSVFNTGPTATPTVTPTVTPSTTSTPTPLAETTATATRGAIELRENEKVRAFPNPGREKITFVLNLEGGHSVVIDLFNLAGERIVRLPADVSGRFPEIVWVRGACAAGVYFARITVDGREFAKTKVAVY